MIPSLSSYFREKRGEKKSRVSSAAVWSGHPDQQYGHTTYAQHGDDLVVVALFDSLGIGQPSYLDVGAHHPFNISNTALLHRRGSRGVNVEANPNLFEAFLLHRPDDVNLNVGISPGLKGVMTFHMIDKWSGRNSFDRGMVEAFVRAHPQFAITETLQIDTVPLQEVIDRHCGGKFPDFMTIDVEGLDEAILRSVNLAADGPKVLCVETVSASGERSSSSLVSHLEDSGYFSLMHCGGNSIFLRNEFERLVR